ncbi:hypothetical protein [Delftia deserti]|uniref:Uncharacterized protein n=1 Tax=Delftia deserti TaxID=1651218 RepID=A0ABW5EP77_9BURK
MQDKHTPGPWEATGNFVRSPMHQPEGLPRGVQIVECRDGYFLPHTEEAKANARLIAAAPDMLAALRDVVAVMERDLAGLVVIRPELTAARAAIAKATGSTQ